MKPPFLERPRAVAWAIIGAFMAVSLADPTLCINSDAAPAHHFPRILMENGCPTFTPENAPQFFVWSLELPERAPSPVRIDRWSQQVQGRSAERLRDDGFLKMHRHNYNVVPTRSPGHYVSFYGPLPGLLGVPGYGIIRLGGGGTRAHWYADKVMASLLVGASGALVHLTLFGLGLRPPWTLAIAFLYLFGTCAWSTGAQALYQQTPVLFFLALGIWAYLKLGRGRGYLALAGFAFGGATFARPTVVLVSGAVALHLLITERRNLYPYLLGALFPALLFCGLNYHWFGSPWPAPLFQHADEVAAQKMGRPGAWQTPLWEGAAGLLLSPARGLLIYSPFMIFAFWGLIQVFRDDALKEWRPLSLGLAGMLLLYFKWFDWWGGWSFGYRILLDTLPLLTLFLAPAIQRFGDRTWLRRTTLVLGSLSVLIHSLAAYGYNAPDWNALLAGYVVPIPGTTQGAVFRSRQEAEAYAARKELSAASIIAIRQDIDEPRYRNRLWSFPDNPISWLAANLGDARVHRLQRTRQLEEPKDP